MKNILIVIAVFIVSFFGVRLFRNHSTTPNQQIVKKEFTPYQAAFAIYTNGTLRQFTGAMYVNQSPDIFIEDINPNTIQVKKEGLTWQDFFNTLPFTVTPTCLTTGTGQTFCSNESTALRFFLNGTENPQLLQQLIQPNDRVLISYGVTTEAQVKQQYNSVPLLQ